MQITGFRLCRYIFMTERNCLASTEQNCLAVTELGDCSATWTLSRDLVCAQPVQRSDRTIRLVSVQPRRFLQVLPPPTHQYFSDISFHFIHQIFINPLKFSWKNMILYLKKFVRFMESQHEQRPRTTTNRAGASFTRPFPGNIPASASHWLCVWRVVLCAPHDDNT